MQVATGLASYQEYLHILSILIVHFTYTLFFNVPDAATIDVRKVVFVVAYHHDGPVKALLRKQCVKFVA